MANEPNFSASRDRLPPQNIEAEEAILGGILLDPEAIGRVAELLQAENFAVLAHQIIYQAALTLHLQGKPTDLMTLTSWLADHNQLEKVGGQGKLAQLVERTISAINIDQYSHLVVDKSIRRQLIYAGNGIMDLGYQTELELEEVLDKSEQLLLNLTQVRPQQSLVPIGETLINTFQDIEDRNEGVTLPGIPCGFYDLDAMTGGFQRSDLIIVAGRPSMGKCLSYDAEIVLADGSIATIEEIYQAKAAKLLTLTDNLNFEFTQPDAYIDDGIKPVFKITTKLGRQIETTLTHPFLTSQGWQALSELKIGDKIAIPNIINIFGNKELSFNEIRDLAKKYHNKIVPENIFKLKRSQIAFFLHQLFTNFGIIAANDTLQFKFSLHSSYSKYLQQIQHLLLRFAIISSFNCFEYNYSLEITESNSIHILISEIICFVDRKNPQNYQSAIYNKVWHNSEIAKTDQSQLSSSLITLEEKQEEYNLKTKKEIYWDEITQIEYTGLKQVYDLTIPETHNFVANDICVHNTSFAVGIAHNIAKTQNLSTAIYSLEMSKEQLVQRLLSSESRIESNRLRSGRISQAEWEPLTMAIGTLSELSIFIDDTPNITVTEMRSKARRLQAEQGAELGLVLIDYLQLMEGSSDNRVQELSRITRALKGMARELNVPVIALSQLSRGVEARTNKRPMMSDLRESGCLTGDSLISLADEGIEVPIRELIGKSHFPVWAINPATMKLEKAIVSHVFYTGVKAIYKLKTALGRTIRATANHQFLTINGWLRLDQLKIDSRIALPRYIPSPSSISMSDSELGLLGHLIGDGCTLPRHVIQYTTKEKDLANIVVSLATQAFSHHINPRIVQERNWYQVYLPASYHLTHNKRNKIAQWLDSLGIFGLRSHEKFVPNLVFKQSEAAIATFLRHLWSTDGSIKLVKGKSIRPIAYYASSSKKLAYQVQSLLLRLYINAKVSIISQGSKGGDNFHVIVTGKPDIENFIQKVGTVGNYKKRSLLEITEYIAVHSANTNRDIIPCDVWRMFAVPAMQNCGLTTRQMQSQLGTQYCGTNLYKHNLSRERTLKLAEIVQSEKLAVLAESDVYWDKVISIEPDGDEEVYDLTVPGLHNFIANNIVVHNSIEQDADLVIMLYRDEYYNPDTPDRGISEIIITKHRNGPTGTVKLLFDPQYTRFRNLAASERYSFPKNPPNQLPSG